MSKPTGKPVVETRWVDFDDLGLELREDGDATHVTGTIIRYGDVAEFTWGDVKHREVIKSKAFGYDLNRQKGIQCNLMHDRTNILGLSDAGGGLEINDSDEACRFDVGLLMDSIYGREAQVLIKGRRIRGASVEMMVEDDTYDRETRTRTVNRAKLVGFGLVDVPAYKDSSINLRDGRLPEGWAEIGGGGSPSPDDDEQAKAAAEAEVRGKAAKARLDLERAMAPR